MPYGSGRPDGPDLDSTFQDEYRRRQEAVAQRRKKRRQKQLVVAVALVGAVVLLVLCAVMIFRAFSNDTPVPVPTPQPGSESGVVASSGVVSSQRPVAADPTAWNLMIINENNPMPDGFEPETTPVDNIGHLFDTRAAEKLTEMVAACNGEEGNNLAIASAYRGPKTQNGKYEALVESLKQAGAQDPEGEAKKIDPPYGYSDHQTALSVDFIVGQEGEPTDDFDETQEASWLRVNAADYGFILRFPQSKEAITGITFQPYHYRYVGVEEAKAIADAGICLEEYVAQQPAASMPPKSTQSTSSTE